MLKTLLNSLILFTGCLLFQTHMVSAAQISQLDETLVQVESRSAGERKKAISAGLKNIVLKNSGAQASLTHPNIQAKIKNPASLLRQYGYQEIEGKLFLKVNFDHQQIIKLLRDAQLPVWGKQRPLTLMWLVEENGEGRQIINDASLLESRTQFQLASENSGVPLMFPVMDLDDNMKVAVSDIRGMFVDQVANASQRYQADYFVMASLDTRGGEEVKYQFSLYPKGSGQSLLAPLTMKRGIAGDTRLAVIDIISAVSDYYVSQYAIADSGIDLDSYVTFIDITEMKQLVEIEKYLKQLSAVKSVQLTQLHGTSVKFKLDLFGTVEDLHRLMKLEPRVIVLEPNQPVNMPTDGFDVLPNSEQKTSPKYRWRG